jgi:hypothetical protein
MIIVVFLVGRVVLCGHKKTAGDDLRQIGVRFDQRSGKHQSAGLVK